MLNTPIGSAWSVMHNLINAMTDRFHNTVRIVALMTVINGGDQQLWKATSQLAYVRDPEPERGLTNVLSGHQAGDPCIRSCHSGCRMWHSVPLHQLLDVFWCRKCFESGLPGTGDMGQKKRHQSPGCPRERHSILAFWDSFCPVRSCGVTFQLLASRGWLTLTEVVGGHGRIDFGLTFKIKVGFNAFLAVKYYMGVCMGKYGTCKVFI